MTSSPGYGEAPRQAVPSRQAAPSSVPSDSEIAYLLSSPTRAIYGHYATPGGPTQPGGFQHAEA